MAKTATMYPGMVYRTEAAEWKFYVLVRVPTETPVRIYSHESWGSAYEAKQEMRKCVEAFK